MGKREKGKCPRPPCQMPHIREGWYPPSAATRNPGFPGTQDCHPLRPKFGCGDCFFCRSLCSDGPRPSAPTPGPPRGPHPSRSFNGNSPKPCQTRDPQFRRRELRMIRNEERRGRRILPGRDWLGGRGSGPEDTQGHVCGFGELQ